MSEKRFQKTRIVDKWGGIYDSKTDKILNVNDVEHKLNEQQATINRLQEENESLKQRKNGDSYCTKKREILTFLERNWTGSFSEYEFSCFRPSERTREYLEKHYEKLGLK